METPTNPTLPPTLDHPTTPQKKYNSKKKTPQNPHPPYPTPKSSSFLNDLQLLLQRRPHRPRPRVERHPGAHQQGAQKAGKAQRSTEEEEAQEHGEDHLRKLQGWGFFNKDLLGRPPSSEAWSLGFWLMVRPPAVSFHVQVRRRSAQEGGSLSWLWDLSSCEG